MNTSTIPALKKFKRGQSFIHNGKEVFVFTQRDSETVIVSFDSQFKPGSNFDLVLVDELEEIRKVRLGIKSKPITTERQAIQSDLNAFYDTIGLAVPFYCENCGKPLYAITKFFKRCTTAHILPKAEFESVATNKDNIMFLGWGVIGICFCHDDWDRKGAEHRSEMAVYPLALERFEKIKDCLTPHELIKAYDYLNIKL